tara:strand:+ start:49 stop:1110 length:1062 start_codon:yes stop_codon:yes gene_type:complete
MAIKYLDSKRIVASGIGTDLDGVGGWKEVARTTLGTAGDVISVTNIPNKRYYQVLCYPTRGSGDISAVYRLNNDSTSTYAYRTSDNGGTDSISGGSGDDKLNIVGGNNQAKFFVGHIANLAGKEKLIINDSVTTNYTGSASNADPKRRQFVGKWVNTSDSINRIDCINQQGGNFGVGSELVVLGYDPDDSHTTNFWEQLTSVDYNASTPDELDTGTITAKKYLWVQAFVNTTGTQDNQAFRFNGDTGNNYGLRDSADGGTDTTSSPYNYLRTCVGDEGNNFVNAFIINNTTTEKLIISHAVKLSTSGTGTAPERNESVGKWANTSAQITSIKLWQSGGGSFASGAIMKVWGSN